MMKIILLVTLLFNIEMSEVDYKEIDNSVIIALNMLYCNECLLVLDEIRSLWSDKYKTILITKSSRNSKNTTDVANSIKKKFKYDEIYFVESHPRKFHEPFRISKYIISNSPTVIIRKGNQEQYIPFGTIFHRSYTKESVKKAINDAIRKIEDSRE